MWRRIQFKVQFDSNWSSLGIWSFDPCLKWPLSVHSLTYWPSIWYHGKTPKLVLPILLLRTREPPVPTDNCPTWSNFNWYSQMVQNIFSIFFFPSQNLGYSQIVQNIFSIFFVPSQNLGYSPKWSKTFLYFFFFSFTKFRVFPNGPKHFLYFFFSFTKFRVFGKTKVLFKKEFQYFMKIM